MVTGVAVTSPTEIILTIDTLGATAGGRSLTVTNPDGQSSALAAALTINATPTAGNDSYSTAFNTPLPVAAPGVLANDSDANGDALTATLVAGPTHGSLTLNPDGSFLYVPTAGFVGNDVWSYQAFDGVGSSAVATVGITVGVNTPPSISAPPSQSLIDNGTGATTAAPGFTVSDAESTTVTVSATSSNIAVVAGSGIVLGGSAGNRTVAVSSVAGSAGGSSSTITLTASDGELTSTATFAVSVSPLRGRPQNVASVVARNAVSVTWSAPSFSAEPVTGYVIEAGLSPGATLAALSLGNVFSFSNVVPSARYFVRVRSVTAAGPSAPSDEVVVATGDAAPPLAPQALLATVQGNNVSFQWQENPLGTNVTQYQLHAGSGPGSSDLGVLSLAAGTTAFSGTAPTGAYFVRVVAANASGAGPASNESAVTLGAGICTAPEMPTGLTATPQAGAVTLRWDAPARGAIPTGYRLEAGASPGSSGIGTLSLPASTVAAGPVPRGTYFVRLAATNACGPSAVSTEITFVVP